MDNAEPSTNGVSAGNLCRLGSMLNSQRYEKLAKRTVKAFEVEMSQHPGLFTGLLGSVIMSRMGVRGIMVSGNSKSAEDAVKALRTTVRPGSTIIRIGGGAKDDWLRSQNELVRDVDGERDMVQLCEGTQCKLLQPHEVLKALRGTE